ncbi:hypothetical protein PP7435_CHR4-1972 [Komagataella phaffii CBS 7435]|uniref:Transporter n=2 Tax=Komagataella phaffii TaxID=460519 RepID=C4R6S4_KOMPG|nr:uncharacterized protein PAS_chr4_0917 [Komagataella phaffii GS115]AOA65015.1 GQ67_04380T0 [Komagataella phaffii]CAH2451357.1 hypothetical protein BQ9382_C4-4935 [Komagataella phaffii CBS 7435]AOA70388.1 GQ68_04352T0 [Komagataella phaffii GS115]CAY71299.1 hypothetical protein PAS_chr4_0917 [Komagataella phaffii GS115]SCV12431.1 hypothetical protein PP7435_CHR4-1972 [Komagataella phaffii CBS 7435]
MASLSVSEITFLTFQAVVQVVLICSSGYWASKVGLLGENGQKVLSRLNVDLFTPCLIFTKLASSLSVKKLIQIIVIPIFYAVTTLVSFVCSKVACRVFRFNGPESGFVTAMSVFGNSNSLPVSLTVALAYTLPNLSWDDIEDDTPDKIASRGILYLLIFQQLGQMLRWSWGYNKLLRKRSPEELEHSDFDKAGDEEQRSLMDVVTSTISNGMYAATDNYVIDDDDNDNDTKTNYLHTVVSESPCSSSSVSNKTQVETISILNKSFTLKEKLVYYTGVFTGFMNPPLYAMLLAVFVASTPPIRDELYENNGFVQNTLGSAVRQLGSISIPLILVVLGSNLNPSSNVAPPSRNYGKMIFASLLCRMILPSLILLPLIAICVKYLGVSVLGDPVFLIVSFILTVSPPAIQLSQICQLNELYEMEMAGVLFWGYVILTLPSTILIVVGSLKVLEWSQ